MKLLLLCTLIYSTNVFSWGKTGHRADGELASKHLSKSAKKAVKKLLGNESLAHASLWPDRIKSDPKMRKLYSKYHYINVPRKKSLKEVAKLKTPHIINGLEKFSATLKNKKASKAERVIALKFIVHLMGDLHQPLHVGFEDRGGNDVKLEWFGRKTNLHVVWDEHLIDMEELSFTEYTKMLNFYTEKEKVNKRLRAGGYRLAHILNKHL